MRRLFLLILTTALAGAALAQEPILLSDFESGADWQAVTSDGVELRLGQDDGRRGKAMRLDFDFHGGSGYAIARKNVELVVPENYEFSFWLRAEAPTNNLEFKLVDPSGENVWWVNRRDFAFPATWRKISLKKRHFSFAWGPLGGGEPSRIGAIEIVVAAGSGGKGTLWIDDLTLVSLPSQTAVAPEPRESASSSRPGRGPENALDSNRQTLWHSLSGEDQWFEVDFVDRRDFGGLKIEWGATQFAPEYEVQLLSDENVWDVGSRIVDGNGGTDFIYLPESEARKVRLRMSRSSEGRGYAIREITVEPVEWSLSLNDFWTSVASESKRGDYPRHLYKEQLYWTVVGVDGDSRESLLSEDGMVETNKGSFSIEPFLMARGKLIGWADVKTTHTLADGYVPVPTVTWQAPGLRMEVTAHASGPVEKSTVYVRYRVHSDSRQRVTLFLALRPFQVNPPWQFLSTIGGFAPIRTIEFDQNQVLVNDSQRVALLTTPSRGGAGTFNQADIVELLRAGRTFDAGKAEDPNGFASAALAWDLDLSPTSAGDVEIAIPLHAESSVGTPDANAVVAEWREKLNRTFVQLPGADRALADTLRSNLGYILINRDGPAIQPGSRSYERSWIRDGSLTSLALLRLGHADTVRQFIEWYAPYQFPNGKVPCCVDWHGAGSVPEHDSHGQLIFLIAEYYRYTGDRELLERMWPHVEKAVAYIDSLRRERMTAQYATPEMRAFFGLVPESISHEGYSAKPMHSYWDDLFVLKGLTDAAWIAAELNKREPATRFGESRDEFRRHLVESFELAMKQNKIDYLPGSVELGDFDATSTTVAVTPTGAMPWLPRPALLRTFERYWQNHLERVKRNDWDGYTPYEWRTVGTFVRLGQKDRAHRLADFFFQHQRPRGWNHWAEVVFRKPRQPQFIGDMPHTWVGSDYIRSFLDMLAYTDDEENLVVGAGMEASWVQGAEPVEVRNLQTTQGAVNLKVRGTANEVIFEVSGDPLAGDLILHSPRGRAISASNGTLSSEKTAVRLTRPRLPVVLTFRY